MLQYLSPHCHWRSGTARRAGRGCLSSAVTPPTASCRGSRMLPSLCSRLRKWRRW
uniref:Uncharacterized protein n=1 Tax=Arundo donax TaxID=35708 RepID=A0A0A9DS60_ARUDO